VGEASGAKLPLAESSEKSLRPTEGREGREWWAGVIVHVLMGVRSKKPQRGRFGIKLLVISIGMRRTD
jgi:hypothetical protein